MKRFTVLGARGYIGRHLVAYLRANGHEVLAPDRGSDIVRSQDMGHVIYAVGLTANFRQRPFDTVEAHIGHLGRILQEASFDTLLYLSSTRVYGRCEVADESVPLSVLTQDPSDLYNLSKLMGESLALHCGRRGVRVARLSNVVGGTGPSDSFITCLIREARTGGIHLQTARTSRKDYIHIEDAVRMLSLVSMAGTQNTYNIASGVQIEHGQWAEALRKRFDCRVDFAELGPEVVFPQISIGRFVREFSFRPGSAMRVIEELA